MEIGKNQNMNRAKRYKDVCNMKNLTLLALTCVSVTMAGCGSGNASKEAG
ncbi:tripartite tricarboxylate transporter substrate binding protein, partial [Acinetobacter sp. A11]